MWILRLGISLLLVNLSHQQLAVYDCPGGWEDFGKYCYKFVNYPLLNYNDAHAECVHDGAFPLTVNSDGEHMFLIGMLSNYDPGQIKRNWWTSGKRVMNNSEPTLEFFWEGDGSKVESYFYWLDDTIPSEKITLNSIVYSYDGYKWAWDLAPDSDRNPFVCKISKDDIHRIQQGERYKDFGYPTTNEDLIPFGPSFILQPQEVVYEPIQSQDGILLDQTSLECRVHSNPQPTYSWVKTRGGVPHEISTSEDDRYTIISGKLLISRPSQDWEDDGTYHCIAGNEYGFILSNAAALTFGYLNDFPKSPRSPVRATAYTWTSIDCNPPSHYPAIQYAWYKNDPGNYIQTDLKPYMFISNDGRLYFSEVTNDDVGEYFCVVTRTGTNWNSGVSSLPTQLIVTDGSPGVYEPSIPDQFPAVFPESAKVGDDVRLECWASGTSRPAMDYFWRKVIMNQDGTVLKDLPLPNQATLADHNRILKIPNITLYDAGNYSCSVTRPFGRTITGVKQIILEAEPYFMLPLRNQYPDIDTELSWRCDAGGTPAPEYAWYKNGRVLVISAEDQSSGRVVVTKNVLTISNLNAEKDNGMYQCAASNFKATRYSSAELKVMSFAPTFAKYPLLSNQFATNGGNTTLLCRVEAAPTPTITWYKNGAQISDSDTMLQLPNGNLYMSPVRKSDAGNYTCHASNQYGEASSSGVLAVLDSVTISRVPESESIPVGQGRFLHCTASYNPHMDVQYTWYHSGMLIEFEKVFRSGENKYQIWVNPHYQRGVGVNVGGLLIQEAEQEHEGSYTCVVETSLGDSFERSAEVKIVGPPWPPAGVDVQSYTTTTAAIRWRPGGSNGASIRSYVIEAYNHWENFWRIIDTNAQPTADMNEMFHVEVTGLRPFSRYELRVRAENIYGTSDPSVSSGEFDTPSVKPDLAPENIRGGGGKVGTLVVEWDPLDDWEENGAKFVYVFFWRPLGVTDFGGNNKTLRGNVGRYIHLVGELNFYAQYEVALRASNEKGMGPMSEIVRIRSAMGLPKAIATNILAQPYNATACRVIWEQVNDNRENMKGRLGGYKVAFWPIAWREDYENPDRVTFNGQQSEGMVIGLQPNSQYYFAVYVWNEAGNGPKSQVFQQRTLRNAPINQPVEVKVFRKSETSIHVYFRGVSTSYLEEPLEGYKIRIWRDREDIKFAQDYSAGKETDMFIDGLHPDNMYKLRVFGYSRGGDGTMSSPAVVFMLGAANGVKLSLLALLMPVCLAFWCLFL